VKVHKDIYLAKIAKPFVTVGVFDGVHLGHQLIFNELNKFAKSNDGESAVVTFWPHPKMIIDNSCNDLMMITSMDEKLDLIEKLGIDHLIILPFSKAFSQLSSMEFIEQYLYNTLHAKGLIVGFNHRFGKDREGDFSVLQQYAHKYQFKIQKVEALSIDNVDISSTLIRNVLLKGQIELANLYLAHNFSLNGQVVMGKQIGRSIGFPTANIKQDFSFKIIPADGVYAVKVLARGVEYPGMLNIGNRPTVNSGGENKSIEVHLLGFNDDLYGEEIRVSFFSRIRDEVKFKNIEELKSQLDRDKLQIQNYFSEIKS